MSRTRRLQKDPRYTTASIDPLTLRYLAMVVGERGADPASLCYGLGFTVDDLQQPDFRISYRQGSLMIRRAYKLIGDPALGLIVGSRETPISWGLVGFGMMSCRTLGEATTFGIRYQKEAGSLAHITLEETERTVAVVTDPLFFDPDIEMFLIEEMFSSIVGVTRALVGADFKPAAVEMVYRRPAHASLYDALFDCPVRFGAPRNRFVTAKTWMAHPLATHDALVARSVEDLIEKSLLARRQRVDLGATVERAIRENLHDLPSLTKVASTLNVSERTLRRRMADAGYSYQGLVDSVRKARAFELLAHSACPVAEVANQTGFHDVRNFRKAFRRWTGVSPSEFRDAEADTDEG